jgi:transposase-like protein
MNVAEFMERFGSQEACVEHLRSVRWGRNLERFACLACGHRKGWWLPKRQLVECCECHRQTSVTAGTVFHRLRSPLWKWFWAIYQLAQDKKGIAAIELAKQISVSYSTAWLILHKLRRAMRRRDEGYVLQGLVEVDETYVGGKAEGPRGRGANKKTPVAVALELRSDGKPGHVGMGSLERVDGRKRSTKDVSAIGGPRGSAQSVDGDVEGQWEGMFTPRIEPVGWGGRNASAIRGASVPRGGWPGGGECASGCPADKQTGQHRQACTRRSR